MVLEQLCAAKQDAAQVGKATIRWRLIWCGYKWVRATRGCGYNWVAANLVRLSVGGATTKCVSNRVYCTATCQPVPATQREEKRREREIEKRRQRSLCWLEVDG